jgi:hypothetical protein
MKPAFKISIWLNLGLLCSLIFVVVSRRKETAAIPPQVVAVPVPVAAARQPPKPFRWGQLESTNDYRVYVANLRAIGCPEPTIRDIVSGDAERGFSFERAQLGLDGSGSGKWSRLQQAQTVATLLGKPAPIAEAAATAQNSAIHTLPDDGTQVAKVQTGAQNAEQSSVNPAQNVKPPPKLATTYVPSYPLAFENVNQDVLNLSAGQKAAIQQVQQQFVNEVGDPNQDPSSPAYLAKWQTAQSSADDMLRGLLGTQAYMAYEQQQYDNWFAPQVESANAEGKPLTINPGNFSK